MVWGTSEVSLPKHPRSSLHVSLAKGSTTYPPVLWAASWPGRALLSVLTRAHEEGGTHELTGLDHHIGHPG